LKNKERELLNMPMSVVEEITERSLRHANSTDEPQMVKFLMKLKRCPSIFDLFQNEKIRVL
jgi:hypothetical protein